MVDYIKMNVGTIEYTTKHIKLPSCGHYCKNELGLLTCEEMSGTVSGRDQKTLPHQLFFDVSIHWNTEPSIRPRTTRHPSIHPSIQFVTRAFPWLLTIVNRNIVNPVIFIILYMAQEATKQTFNARSPASD